MGKLVELRVEKSQLWLYDHQLYSGQCGKHARPKYEFLEIGRTVHDQYYLEIETNLTNLLVLKCQISIGETTLW